MLSMPNTQPKSLGKHRQAGRISSVFRDPVHLYVSQATMSWDRWSPYPRKVPRLWRTWLSPCLHPKWPSVRRGQGQTAPVYSETSCAWDGVRSACVMSTILQQSYKVGTFPLSLFSVYHSRRDTEAPCESVSSLKLRPDRTSGRVVKSDIVRSINKWLPYVENQPTALAPRGHVTVAAREPATCQDAVSSER